MYAFGHELTMPLIVDNLPKNYLIHFFKVIFCFNLIITYPLMINVANEIIESYLFGKMRLGKNKRNYL